MAASRPDSPLPAPGDWLAPDDPASLPRRTARLVEILGREAGSACAECGVLLCGHHVLFAVACGYEDAPLCPTCTADDLGRQPDDLRASLLRFVFSKECMRRAWALVAAQTDGACACDTSPSGIAISRAAPDEPAPTAPSAVTARWDAGDLGCGELVLELRTRLRALHAGDVLHLTATDPGAPEDIPAWCGLTGNPLVASRHPDYMIRRKD